MCDMAHSYVWHGSFIWVAWLIHKYDMTHSYIWHCSSICPCAWYESFICVTWLIHMCDVIHVTHSLVRHDTFTTDRSWEPKAAAVDVPIHKPLTYQFIMTWPMCDTTQPYKSYDSSMSAEWLIRMHDMTHWCVRHDSLVCATWLIGVCDMTHWCVRHDSLVCATWLTYHRQELRAKSWSLWCTHAPALLQLIRILREAISHVRVNESCLTCEWVMVHVWMSRVTHMDASCHTHNEPCPTYEWVMSHIWMRHVTHIMSQILCMQSICVRCNDATVWMLPQHSCNDATVWMSRLISGVIKMQWMSRVVQMHWMSGVI